MLPEEHTIKKQKTKQNKTKQKKKKQQQQQQKKHAILLFMPEVHSTLGDVICLATAYAWSFKQNVKKYI